MGTILADAPFRVSKTPTEAELLGKYFQVLADPTRLRILEALEEQRELAVGELVERLASPGRSSRVGIIRVSPRGAGM